MAAAVAAALLLAAALLESLNRTTANSVASGRFIANTSLRSTQQLCADAVWMLSACSRVHSAQLQTSREKES